MAEIPHEIQISELPDGAVEVAAFHPETKATIGLAIAKMHHPSQTAILEYMHTMRAERSHDVGSTIYRYIREIAKVVMGASRIEGHLRGDYSELIPREDGGINGIERFCQKTGLVPERIDSSTYFVEQRLR